MEVEIIRSIQSVSSEFLDGLYYLFTQCGQVVFFLGIFAITYWCISTNEAIKIGLIYCISALFNNGVKFLVKRPRPYLVDPTLRNIHTATGYSFPSGHSQSYGVLATTFGITLFRTTRDKWIRYSYVTLAFILGAGVMLSRMYFGQHFLTDVITGMATGILVAIICEAVYYYMPKGVKNFGLQNVLLIGIGIAIIAVIVLVCCGVKSASVYRYCTLFIALSGGHLINCNFIHFDPKSTSVNKWIILAIGLILTFGTYALFSLITQSVLREVLSIFFASMMITIVVPLTGKWMERYKRSRL